MTAQCTMRGCGQLIIGPDALALTELKKGEPPSDQEEYSALEGAITAHMIQHHPDVCQAIALTTARYAGALFSKLVDAVDPRFPVERYESFKLIYWSLMGELTTTQTAGKVQLAGETVVQRPLNQA